MTFDLVIFDCDGVLVDSELIGALVLTSLLASYGIDLDPHEARSRYCGFSVGEIQKRIESYYDIRMRDDWTHGYYETLIETLRTQAQPIAGVKVALEHLRQAGLPVCVASQGPLAKMEAALSGANLWDRFAGRAFSAKSVARPKPSPDVFLHAASVCGATPDRCAVIEDSETGILAALAASMTVFAYCPAGGERRMRELGATPFPSMEELPRLLTRAPHQ